MLLFFSRPSTICDFFFSMGKSRRSELAAPFLSSTNEAGDLKLDVFVVRPILSGFLFHMSNRSCIFARSPKIWEPLLSCVKREVRAARPKISILFLVILGS